MDKTIINDALIRAIDSGLLGEEILDLLGSDFEVGAGNHGVSVESLWHTYRRRLARFTPDTFEYAEIARLLDVLRQKNGQLQLVPILKGGEVRTLLLMDDTGKVLYWSRMWTF
ncbi:hypothetical protein [Microbispora siamensis]|uniref:Uncharacterized protein n=1 Tax=Microbispora siamensis TaxID=564413 RepID=A0ABQ4H204_9ACTN|nr:hypothetical protein [Microbispora siamensis]GIH67559.1 hypothetical protein Msi02_83760 [Microbispora siamensis]